MERRAGRGEGAGSVAGRLQALEVAEQPSVGLSLDVAVRQEADRLLHAARVAVAARHQARGHAGLLLLMLPDSQIGHGHLQDVRLLLLGVGLLPDELGTEQRFQLLDAGVDAVSAQFLDHWLSHLRKRYEKNQLEYEITLFFVAFEHYSTRELCD